MEIKQYSKQTAYNLTKSVSRSIRYIVVHYTGTTASALNNIKYFSGGNRGASADYFIDDNDIYQFNPDPRNYYAWHCGDGHGAYGITNANSIGIEVVSDGADFTEAEISKLAWLVQKLMNEYGVEKHNVVRHYDASRKQCPAPYITLAKWNSLRERLFADNANGTNVQGYTLNRTPAQKWKFIDCGDGWYKIVNVGTNRVLDVSGGSKLSGTNVHAWSADNGTDAQRWKIQFGGLDTVDKYFALIPKLNENLRLDLSGANADNGANVQVYTYNGTDAQRWTAVYAQDGCYYLLNVATGSALDVAGGK